MINCLPIIIVGAVVERAVLGTCGDLCQRSRLDVGKLWLSGSDARPDVGSERDIETRRHGLRETWPGADAVTSKIIIQTTQFVAVREGRWGIGVIEILVDCMTSSWSYERGSRVRFEGFVGSQLLLCVPLLRLMGLS